ncbi:MAG: hypothetical protein HUK09_03740, partial [Bacteroidaceae bacterium]|nr:hypothetical protein [Bacteroidaceae bacterium]
AHLECTWQARPRLRHAWRYRLRSQQHNITGHRPLLEYRITHQLQWQLNRDGRLVSWQTQAAIALHHRQTTARPSVGLLAAARLAYTPHPRWQFQGAATGFRTDDFDTRLYAYQPQLPSMMSFPLFYRHGFALTAQARCRLTPRLHLALRAAHLHYLNAATIGSGVQQIAQPYKTDLACWIRYQF